MDLDVCGIQAVKSTVIKPWHASLTNLSCPQHCPPEVAWGTAILQAVFA